MTTIREICTKPDGRISIGVAGYIRLIRGCMHEPDGNPVKDIIYILSQLSESNLTLRQTDLGQEILQKVRDSRRSIYDLIDALNKIEEYDEVHDILRG